MPVIFKMLDPNSQEWRRVNDPQIALDCRGALFGAVEKHVQLKSRMGYYWFEGGIQVELSSELFRDLAQSMMDADPEAATKAFGATLVMGARRFAFNDESEPG